MTTETKVPRTKGDFMCRCDDEGKAHCDAVMEEVLTRLSAGSDELMAREVTRENLLSAVVLSLEWDYHANIESIHCDQWSGVSAVSHRSVPGTKRKTFDPEAEDWQEWLGRHDDHKHTKTAISHPEDCDLHCLDDAPSYPWSESVEDARVWIECDEVEDGIAAAWKFFADRAAGNTGDNNLTSDSEERG